MDENFVILKYRHRYASGHSSVEYRIIEKSWVDDMGILSDEYEDMLMSEFNTLHGYRGIECSIQKSAPKDWIEKEEQRLRDNLKGAYAELRFLKTLPEEK